MIDSLSALREPAVRRFLIGRTLAAGGRQMTSVAVGWQLYERTGSALVLGLVGLVQVVPVFALALVAGSVVDKFPRRNVAALAEAVFFTTGLGLCAASAWQAPIAIIYAMLFVMGVAKAFSSPAQAAMLPTLVSRANFANANAWSSSGFELASMAGPALAGGLIAWTGTATTTFALQAGLSGLYLLLLLSLPRVDLPASPKEKGAARAGLRFMRRTPLLLSAITLDTFAVLLGGSTDLLPIFAKDILHVGPSGLGWLRAAPSFGAFGVAILTTRRPPWKQPGRVLLFVVCGFGLATLGFGLSTSFPLSMFMLFLTGVFDNVSVVIRLTLEQMVTPESLRGRVSAIHYVFIGTSNELGSFESGFTASLMGAVGSVVFGGIGTLAVVGVVALIWPMLARTGPLNTLVAGDPEALLPET